MINNVRRNIITGIDIGSSSIRVAVTERFKDQEAPAVLALVKKNSRGLRRGYIVNMEETVECLKDALNEAEKVAKIKISKAFVGVSGVTIESRLSDGLVVVSRSDMEVTNNDVKRAMEEAEGLLPDMNNRLVLHRFPQSFKVDGKKVVGHPEGMRGERLEVHSLFITGSRQHVKDFIQAVEDAGVIVDGVIVSALASSGVLLSKMQRASGCVLANIGSQTTSIAVFEESQPISLSVFPVGSTDVTNDIALGFKISIEEAERMKKREAEPAGARRKLDDIIEARVSDIFDFIEMHLKKIGRDGLLPAGIVITGGGSNISNIEEMARSYFRLPAKIASPARLENSEGQTIDPYWSVAYGLCAYQDEDEAIDQKQKMAGLLRHKFWNWIKEFMP